MSYPKDHLETASAAANADRVWSEFMATLNLLAPEVRAAFLLHEVFEAGYDDIARLIGQPAQVCRGHVEYARAHAQVRMHALSPKAKAMSR
ncbi:sigma factor-like helix-turn-helix DNA-binding protein [Lysobacter sp. cf310]|uniref:sigma factor-like helix-turn-helix DNA-binding protein n=1 Tax=Lysobacter sp. cf310 TaxID=1761790 RepID=UPI000B80BFF2|nr:sigma factor-like helix-turn-helix DNA-binding protein [Lysobacter sp. cf310]